MNGVEDLIIYKQYLELIYYTEKILMKYPKCERFALVTNRLVRKLKLCYNLIAKRE